MRELTAVAPARSLRTVRRLCLLLAALAALGWLSLEMGDRLPALMAWVDGLGYWGPVAFVLIYTVGVVLWLPGSFLTLAAGVLFDLLPATLYVLVGSTAGSALAFLAARYVMRERIERRLASSPRLSALDRALEGQGLKIVLLLRLSPVFPFTPLNFLLGLTRVRFRDYLIASPAMLPATMLYVYTGKVMGDLALLVGGAPPERGATGWLLLGLGLLATGLAAWLITRLARRALEQELPAED